ncbi:MAG: tetratricopeptide repeat protein [Desulfarculaceae bacterium]|jgi:tetratricopeptide (TPR) repeat protein
MAGASPEDLTPQNSQEREQALLNEITRLDRLKDRSAEVIVADDMQTMRLLLSQALRGAGFLTIHRAPDGEAALKIMEDRTCDLALVDWNMPRMDGLQLLDRIRSDPRHNDLVFIMVTGETLDQRVIQAAEEKQDAYLTKPISPQKIDRRLELILEKRLVTAKAFLAEVRGQAEQALEELLAAVQNRPRFSWPLFALGALLSRQGRMEEAERCYQRILDNDPEALLAKVEMGRLREQKGQVDSARQLYHEALTANPHFFRAYDALARSLEAQGDAGQALEALQGALRRQGTENAARQEYLGRLHYELSQYPEAEAAYAKALSLKPRTNLATNSLALAKARLGQGLYEEAMQALERAMTGSGDAVQTVEAMLLAGAAHLHFGSPEKAAEVFNRMQEGSLWPGGKPPFAPHHLHREVGAIYLEAGEEEAARELFTASLNMDFNDEDNHSALRQICDSLGREGLAAEVAVQAEAVRDQTVDEITRRGLDLVGKGQYEAAKSEYLRGLEIDSKSGRLHFNLGKLLYRLKEEKESLRYMAQAARLGLMRKDWHLVVEVARFIAGVGHSGQAEGLLKQTLEKNPGLDAARDLLSEIRLKQLTPAGSKAKSGPPSSVLA